MKKTVFAIIAGFVIAAMSFSLSLAQTDKVNLKGIITVVDEENQIITIQTDEGIEFVVHFPPDYGFSFTIEDKDLAVHIKGKFQDNGIILADWVKLDYRDEDGDDNGDDSGEGTDKVDSAYCSGEKVKSHPAASFLAKTFSKEIDEIMWYFCDGFGFGQISLALQTEKFVDGIDYGTLLDSRAEGVGWGEIWRELGSQGKPKDADGAHPGNDKPSDKDKGADKDKNTNKDKDKDKNNDLDKNDDGKLKDKKDKRPKKDK
jgi:hypothetical protein